MTAAYADASEAGRALAAKRWDPETRLRAAVDTVVRRSADLDASQRAGLLRSLTAVPETEAAR